MSLVRQTSCFQPSLDHLSEFETHEPRNEVADIEASFWAIAFEEEAEEPAFKPLVRCAKVTEAETNTAEMEHWLKAVMLTELEDFQAKQQITRHIQWADDALIQSVLTYSRYEYDRRGPPETEWIRMPCEEYEPEDYIDEMGGCGVSEFPEEEEDPAKEEASHTLLCELMHTFSCAPPSTMQ